MGGTASSKPEKGKIQRSKSLAGDLAATYAPKHSCIHYKHDFSTQPSVRSTRLSSTTTGSSGFMSSISIGLASSLSVGSSIASSTASNINSDSGTEVEAGSSTNNNKAADRWKLAGKAALADAKKKSPANNCAQGNSDRKNSCSSDDNHQDKAASVQSIIQRLLITHADVNVGVTCAGCKQNDFVGYRYKCCKCKNYDLCADCFEKRVCSPDHSSAHPMYFIRSPLSPEDDENVLGVFKMGPDVLRLLCNLARHKDVRCDVCHESPIQGVRIKCDDCADYNMCWSCYQAHKSSKEHNTSHAVVAHLSPVHREFNPRRDITYDNQEYLGQGSFGSVQKVFYEGKPLALKTIRITGAVTDQVHFKSFQNEVFAYSEIHSNQIIKFYGYAVETTDSSTNLFLLTEFMEKGSLRDIITNNVVVPLHLKFHWAISIIKGIRRMHAKGFVHKDIKPDNILVDADDKVKLGDMGIATYDFGRGYFSGELGTVLYTAPEVHEEKKFDNKVDIFSYGLVVYELFTYQRRMLSKLKDALMPVVFPTELDIFMPLITRCVSMDPHLRPSAAELEKMLQGLEDDFWKTIDKTYKPRYKYYELGVEMRDGVFTSHVKETAKNIK